MGFVAHSHNGIFGNMSVLIAMVFLSPALLERICPAAANTAPRATTRADLVGHVHTADGRPIGGITVGIYTAKPKVGVGAVCPSCYVDCGMETTTNRAGLFRLRGVSPELKFQLLVVGNGFVPTLVDDIDPSTGDAEIVIHHSPVVTADRLITERVVGSNGKAITGASMEPLSVSSNNGGAIGSELPGIDPLAVSDLRGIVKLNADPGVTAVALVKARGFAPRIVRDLHAGALMSSIVLTTGCTITGTVHLASDENAPGVVVHVSPTDTEYDHSVGWFDIATDDQGRFSLPNVPANTSYCVCVRMDSLARFNQGDLRQTVSTAAEATTVDVGDIDLVPAQVISGTVVLSDNKPLPAHTHIIAWRDGTHDVEDVEVGNTGDFTFKALPLGETIRIFVRVPGYHLNPKCKFYDDYLGDVKTVIDGSVDQPMRLELLPNYNVRSYLIPLEEKQNEILICCAIVCCATRRISRGIRLR